jgi:SNF2 family DNA or RNA helicase
MAKKDADVTIIYSKDKTPEFADWTIMGYRTAVKFQKQIEQASITTMFVDEAHKCKAVNNFGKPDSKQAETVMSLSRQIEHVYLLTGTPMPTRNKDLFNELVILGELDDPKQNKWSFLKYAKEFCDGHKTAWGFDATGSSNTNELHRILKKYMVRRLKSEVLPNLTKQRIPIIIESKLSKDYLDIEKRLREPDDGDTYMGLAMTGRRYLSKCKIDSAIEFAEDIVDSDESVVIVAEFDETLDALMEHFGDKACCIRGGMSDTAKQRSIDEFQSGQKKVCCINLIAAGVGITLTKAHNMVVLDFDWTPANMTQVEDRICRTGQNNHCNIYYIIHNDSTLDQIFLEMITEKSANIDRVIDNAENTVDLVAMKESANGGDFFTRLKKRVQR